MQGEAWLAMGGGVRQLQAKDPTGYFEIAADLAATFPLGERVRLGPWGRVGSTLQGVDHGAGVRLVLLPIDIDWFFTRGWVEVTVDGGMGYSSRYGPQAETGKSHAFATGRVSFGVRSPLELLPLYKDRCDCSPESYARFLESGESRAFPECRPRGGVVSGARFYVGAHGSVETERLWEVSFGLSFEIVGSGWFLGYLGWKAGRR